MPPRILLSRTLPSRAPWSAAAAAARPSGFFKAVHLSWRSLAATLALIASLAVAMSEPVSAQEFVLGVRIDHATGIYPRGLVLGDLNGDGPKFPLRLPACPETPFTGELHRNKAAAR